MKPLQEDSKHWLKMIGANLKAIRISRKEVICDVSKKLNISQSRLEIIEEGEFDMDLGQFAELCDHYKVRMTDVVSKDFKCLGQ